MEQSAAMSGAQLCLMGLLLTLNLTVSTAARAVPYKGPEPPSASATDAQKRSRFIAAFSPDKAVLEWSGRTYQIKEAWLERTKYEKTLLLCFSLTPEVPIGDRLYFRVGHKFFGRNWSSRNKSTYMLRLDAEPTSVTAALVNSPAPTAEADGAPVTFTRQEAR